MAFGELNGHVTDDVPWPWKVKVMASIRLMPKISKTTGDTTLCLKKRPNF